MNQNFNPNQRRPVVTPRRSWLQNNPRLFQISFITGCMLIFFSRPIYDAFIRDDLPPPRK